MLDVSTTSGILSHIKDPVALQPSPATNNFYTLSREAYERLHAHNFTEALQQLGRCQKQLKYSELNFHDIQNRNTNFDTTGDDISYVNIDFDLLKTQIGVGTRLKQPLEWAELNFVYVFLVNPSNSLLCFEAFGVLAEQYFLFNRQDLTDKLSTAYLETLRTRSRDASLELSN